MSHVSSEQIDGSLIIEDSQDTKREQTDVVSPSRLQAFSDPVFATAATLLIVPLRKFKIQEGETLKTVLINKWPEFLVFLLAYLVICTVWESHIVRYKILKKVDDVVVAVTLVSLMITTFLPYTVALEGHYGKYQVAIILNCLMLLALEVIEAVVFIYAFHNQNLLNEEFQRLEPGERKVKKKQLFIKILINCVLYLLSALFSSASLFLSWVLICAVIATPLLRRAIVKLTRCSEKCHGHNLKSTYEVLTGGIDKERVECFSDAAIAIIATLLILDLTAEDFPGKEEVEKNGLLKVILSQWPMFIAYVGTYLTIGLLWFVHHSVLHHINKFTASMVLVNKFFLAFLAATPFISTLLNKYSGHATFNARVAVGFSSVVIFLASVANFVLLVIAIFWKDVTLYDWAKPRSEDRSSSKAHTYLLIKILIIPVASVVTFLSSLTNDATCYIVYHVVIFITPALFFILKVVYACYCCRGTGTYTQQKNTGLKSVLQAPSQNEII